MARCAGVTQWQVRQDWQAADVRPHRLKTFKLSQVPQFAAKVISEELRRLTSGGTNNPTMVTGRINFCRDRFLD